MRLRILAKVLIHVWSYDFYDMTLSTGKQRRHMINECHVWIDKSVLRVTVTQGTDLSIHTLHA